MKRLLPHLIYLAGIAGLAFFLWQRVEREKKMIRFLNEPAGEAISSLERWKNRIQTSLQREVKKYPSPLYVKNLRQINQADSLISASGLNPGNRTSLPSSLWALVDSFPKLEGVFQTILTSEYGAGPSSADSKIFHQNDSLRRQLAFLTVLHFYAEQFGHDIGLAGWQPTFCSNDICTSIGIPFQADVFLTPFPMESEIITAEVNGQSFPFKDGLAHYTGVFPKAGLYPLQVRFTHRPWDSDSVFIAEKIFKIHVSN